MEIKNKAFTVGNTEQFIAMTRPLIEADNRTMVETLLLLDMKSQGVYGCASEILKLQQKEILNEISLRN